MNLLGDLVAALDAVQALPGEVETAATAHLLDIVGVAAAAAGTRQGLPWLTYAKTAACADGCSSVIGAAIAADAAEAALINGGLMHSLEFDDTHTAAIVHGSAVLASTALAAGEASRCNGRQVLHAYTLWYEVLIRIGLSASGGFQARGFQVSAVGGAICAAGLAATLKGMERDGIANAMGIAISQASGVFAFLSNGATVKSMHPGWAAHAGIKAAELAQAGLSGADRPFDDTFGLFRVFAGDEKASDRFARHVRDIGQHWHLPDVAFKFLPCCHYIHPFVEAAAKLTADGCAAGAIGSVRLFVPPGAAAIVCDPWDEKCRAQGHAARWSLPVVVAMQIVNGKIDLDSFEGEAAPEVHELARRMDWEPLADSRFPASFDAAVEIGLNDGSVRRLRIDDVFGNASRAPSQAQVREKFLSSMTRVLTPSAAERLATALSELAALPDVGDIRALLHHGLHKGTV